MTREVKVFGIDFYVNEEDGLYAKVVNLSSKNSKNANTLLKKL